MSLADLLGEVLDIKGVTSAAVVSGDGSIVEGVSRSGQSLDFIAGLIASGLASSRVLAGILGEGEVEQTMIEYENGPVLLTPLRHGDDDYVAVVAVDQTSTLGRVRFQLRKLLPAIADVVGG